MKELPAFILLDVAAGDQLREVGKEAEGRSRDTIKQGEGTLSLRGTASDGHCCTPGGQEALETAYSAHQ